MFGENWPEKDNNWDRIQAKTCSIFVYQWDYSVFSSTSLYTIMDEETENTSPAQKCVFISLKF